MKYGPGSPEYSRWVSQFLKYDTAAYLIKKGLASPETIYDLGQSGIIPFWAKFKDVIEERRKVAGRDFYSATEFLAGEMIKIKQSRDPLFNGEKWLKLLTEKQPLTLQ